MTDEYLEELKDTCIWRSRNPNTASETFVCENTSCENKFCETEEGCGAKEVMKFFDNEEEFTAWYKALPCEREKCDEELKLLAKDILLGNVYTDRHSGGPEAGSQAFLLLGMMDPIARYRWMLKKPGLIYEYLEKAADRQCNGHPMFMTLQWLNEADAIVMFEFYQRYKAAFEAVDNAERGDD